MADRHHRLWDRLLQLAQADPPPAAEQHNLHRSPRSPYNCDPRPRYCTHRRTAMQVWSVRLGIRPPMARRGHRFGDTNRLEPPVTKQLDRLEPRPDDRRLGGTATSQRPPPPSTLIGSRPSSDLVGEVPARGRGHRPAAAARPKLRSYPPPGTTPCLDEADRPDRQEPKRADWLRNVTQPGAGAPAGRQRRRPQARASRQPHWRSTRSSSQSGPGEDKDIGAGRSSSRAMTDLHARTGPVWTKPDRPHRQEIRAVPAALRNVTARAARRSRQPGGRPRGCPQGTSRRYAPGPHSSQIGRA